MDKDELTLLRESVENGFASVHKRLDAMKDNCAARQVKCIERFSEIETCVEVDNAVKKANEAHNYVPVAIKSIIVFLTGSALAWVWKVALHVGG